MTCTFCGSRFHVRAQCPIEPVWLKQTERFREEHP
jgi:hypothetical protein